MQDVMQAIKESAVDDKQKQTKELPLKITLVPGEGAYKFCARITIGSFTEKMNLDATTEEEAKEHIKFHETCFRALFSQMRGEPYTLPEVYHPRCLRLSLSATSIKGSHEL